MKPLSAALLVTGAAMLALLGMRYPSVRDAFGAMGSHGGSSRSAVQSRRGTVPVASEVSSFASATAVPGVPAKVTATRPSSSPATSLRDKDALAQAARRKLAALRVPLSPEAQNDPFSVLSWLPPPPPPAPVPEVVQAPAPVAPPLPFTYVGMSNAAQAKPQVFLANGDQLLIVSPGDVIDARYRFESIAPTAAVFTYLPLDERQVLTIGGEGN